MLTDMVIYICQDIDITMSNESEGLERMADHKFDMNNVSAFRKIGSLATFCYCHCHAIPFPTDQSYLINVVIDESQRQG